MTTPGKPLLKVLGWVLLVWGILSLGYDLLVLASVLEADNFILESLFGPLDLIAISMVVAAAEVFAGLLAVKWAGDPDRTPSLLSAGAMLAAFFCLEAFFTYTQIRSVYWLHLILGLAAGLLYCWGAWINRD